MGMRIGTEMPSLEGATEWFGGTQAAAEAQAGGHPTLIHFWSLSCGVCKGNMPRIAQWRDEMKEQGLRVIAVHMPRYEADTDVEGVREAIAFWSFRIHCEQGGEVDLLDAWEVGLLPSLGTPAGGGPLRPPHLLFL